MFEPGTPLWRPQTEDEIRRAAESGLLEETHHCDIKRELATAASHNKELARDLASFAVDGGVLVFGIDESTTPPSLSPVSLDGLAERVEQIALMGVQEALAVRTQVLPTADDPARGYLVVTVPPSGRAPHMVDGRYYGRGDKTKRVLSDAEVSRLHDARSAGEVDAIATLRHQLDDVTRVFGATKIIVTANPVSHRDDIAESITTSANWREDLFKVVHAVAESGPLRNEISPDLTYTSHYVRRPRGIAATANIADNRTPASADMKRGVEVVINDDGSVYAACGRPVDILEQKPGQPLVLFEKLILAYTFRVIALAQVVTDRCGYYGSWDFAIGVTGIHGATSWEIESRYFAKDTYAFADNDYLKTFRATAEEMLQTPSRIASALLSRLFRAVGSADVDPMKTLLQTQ